MATRSESALEGLERRGREIEEAKQRLAELEQKRKGVEASLKDAMKPLRAYYRDTEAGHRPADPAVEDELRKKFITAQSRLAPMTSINVRATAATDRVELVDPELEGQIDGARERVDEAVDEYNRFRSKRFDDLVVELGVLGRELAERTDLVAKHAQRCNQQWRALKKRWEPILEVSGFERSDFPPQPFEGVNSEPLMPRKLARGEAVDGPRTPGGRVRRRG